MRILSILLIVAGVALFTGCNLNCISPEGEVVERTMTIDAIDKVNIKCSADVVLTHDPSSAANEITVEAHENIFDLLKISVENDELVIDINGCIVNSGDIIIYANLPIIKRLTTEGSGSITSTNTFVQSDDLKLDIEGSGDIQFSVRTTGGIDAKIEGSGDIELEGLGASIKVEIDGSGDVDASHFKTMTGKVNVDGSGNVHINAVKKLSIDIDGSGNVNYVGNPELNTSIDGSGNIQKSSAQ